MTNKNDSSPTPIYYVSPTGKVHAQTCRYCQPDKDGWKTIDSLQTALEQEYQLCRLCCPSEEEIVKLQLKSDSQDKFTEEKPTTKVSSDKNQETSETFSESSQDKTKDKAKDKLTKNKEENQPVNNKEKQTKEKKNKTNFSSEKNQKDKPPVEKKRYKILAGNGCHQAIAEVRGMLIPPGEGEKSFHLILPDGTQLEATFKNSRILWLAHNKPELLGDHWFRGYPKMKDNKLVSLQIIAWDGTMPTNPRGEESWEFTGVWTLQKNITVQRSMMLEDVRKIAKETGFIKKFKYTFINSFDWVKNKKLWAGYVYKVLCKRKGDVLEIKKVIPYACPRIKPVPKTNNFKGKKPFNKNIKPSFHNK
ncbi:hypothetical protein [Cyanobacterium aponinum]|uniref:Uncharacterized protein n=1 Tax=Cyanobacterium aponinum 0216 TaxID=2676140 RepID=A0A844GYC4_9CHRO|nr:hypothetical protein [Cyanobacterium aponinum]MTF39988.1 hypothetical protein [Cyanobacterium aponinum 0216]